MTTHFTAAITRGMAWLDEEHPGWMEKINLGALAMGDCLSCTLGQVTGHYGKALERALPGVGEFRREAWATQHGFFIDDVCFDDEDADPWDILTTAWKEAITHRLAQKENSK